MGFVLLGLLLTGLKMAGLTVVAQWSWWAVLAPFGLAAIWWLVADALGFTQRSAMRRHDEQAERRREEQYERLGMRTGPRKRNGGASSKWRE